MDQQYFQAVDKILTDGTWQLNKRTGQECCTYPGITMEFDLQFGFPAPTTKPIAWKSVTGEWVGFIRGVTSAADFRALGSKVWDGNANETPVWLANPFRYGPDDLGDVYGAMWRKWPAYIKADRVYSSAQRDRLLATGWRESLDIDDDNLAGYEKEIDQVADCIRKLILTPSDRRILFTGWNPAILDQIALPPCHMTYQFVPNIQKRELSLVMFQRSADYGLGIPFNVAECGLWLHLMSLLCGYRPKRLVITTGDSHIYREHMPALREQRAREPRPLPKLLIDARIPNYQQMLFEEGQDIIANEAAKQRVVQRAIEWLDKIEPSDFVLADYDPHPKLENEMKMAV